MAAPVEQAVPEQRFDFNLFLEDIKRNVHKGLECCVNVLSPTGLGTTLKTRNLAISIFASSVIAFACFVGAGFVPPYLFVGVFIGLGLSTRDQSLSCETRTLWNDNKRLECIATLASIALASYALPKIAFCALATALICNPKNILSYS